MLSIMRENIVLIKYINEEFVTIPTSNATGRKSEAYKQHKTPTIL